MEKVVYRSVESISSSLNRATATTNNIYATMPNPSFLHFYFDSADAIATELGMGNGGVMIIAKNGNYRAFGLAVQYGGTKLWFARPRGQNVLEWYTIDGTAVS